jgi:hypothetical protein
MIFGALFIGGVIGAAETSALAVLVAEYFSRQITDAFGLLMFFFTVPCGALLGTATAAAVIRLDGSSYGSSLFCGGWLLATLLGFPVSGIATMMFSFGPPKMTLAIFVVQLVGLLVLIEGLYRSQQDTSHK